MTTPVFRYDLTYTFGASGNRLYFDNFQLNLTGQAVHISTPPAATASVAANYSGTICAVNVGGTTAPTYTWNRNGTAISGGAYASYYSGYGSATLSAVSIPATESGVSLTCTVGGTYAQSGGATTVTSGACVLTVGTADPCLAVAVVGGITKSPLAPAGQVYSDAATITCTGCSGSATAVKLLDTSNGNAVVGTGTGGSGTVAVNVSGLTTGHILCAVQTVGGVDSCVIGAPTITVGNVGCTYVAAVGGVAVVDPITAGDTAVTVTGVSPSAEDVTVYADGVQVGQNAAPAGATTVTVPTSALVKGKRLTATQKLSGTEGCLPSYTGTTPMVGGGNAALTVCLELDASPAGGAAYTWMGANGRQGGYASPPTGTTVVTPGVGWQTVTWTPATASGYNWNTAAAYTWPSSGSATLQYIWLCPNDNSEMGPYTVYIDTVQNGTASLYNWEGDPIGYSAFMQNPSFATTGRTPVHGGPDLTACVNTNADMGAQCQRMDWEFVNTASANSIRGVLKNGIPVDLSKPITFRILVLPAGTSAPALTVSQPTAKALCAGTAGSVGITATDHSGGSSTITYQWKKNGSAINAGNAGDLTGYDSATLAFGNPVVADSGSYSCAVTNTVTGTGAGTYTAECNQFVVTVNPLPTTSAISGPATVNVNQAGVTYSVTATAGSSYAWTVPSDAAITAGGTGPNNNQITVTFGSASGNVTATETTAGGCVGAPVSLTVKANNVPVAPPNKTLTTVKNTSATFDLVKLLAGATDLDSDTLTVTAASSPTAHGTTVLEANDVKYTPATDYTGPDSYTYTISDGNGGTAIGTVDVTVALDSGLSPNRVGDPVFDSGTGTFSVTFAGIPGVVYTVEYAVGSAAPPWTKLDNYTAGPLGLFTVTDGPSLSGSRYYRTVYPSY